jgi:hypothetical protein
VHAPTDQEWKTTRLIKLRLDEVSAKFRTRPPIDDAADNDLQIWTGIVPIERRTLPAQTNPKLPVDFPLPDFARNFAY